MQRACALLRHILRFDAACASAKLRAESFPPQTLQHNEAVVFWLVVNAHRRMGRICDGSQGRDPCSRAIQENAHGHQEYSAA